MPLLSQLLGSGRVQILDAPDSRDAVLDAAAYLLGDGSAETATEVGDSLRQRERLGSTAIGHGVAIPHGRCGACRDARAAFLRLASPVDFAAADGEPVDLVLAIAAPEHFSQQHLQLLSEIAERFAESSFRDALREARDTEALQAVLAGTVPAT